MKRVDGWWFPDQEAHIFKVMELHALWMNGRLAYQAMKQIKFIELCTSRRAVIDIGAHVGLWSYNLKYVFDNVYAFEPVEEHRECFRKNVEGVELYECALGDSSRFVSMKTTYGSSGDTYVDRDGNIPMKRLDDFKFDGIDAIKMDCQGYESKIIDGAMDTIIRNHPVMVIEEKHGTEAVDKLKKLGYKVDSVINGDHFLTWVQQ